MVTSKGDGLAAVPDWPKHLRLPTCSFFSPSTSGSAEYFPRNTAISLGLHSTVGFLTIILEIWLFGRKSRPVLCWGGILFIVAGLGLCLKFPAHDKENISLSILGLVALAASFFWPKCALRLRLAEDFASSASARYGVPPWWPKGILGGLRVTQIGRPPPAFFTATLAQLFLVLVSFIALSQTEFWQRLPIQAGTDRSHFRLFFVLTTCQPDGAYIILGATMRHQHAGLSIPDFPTAYGKIWPDTSPAAILHYNQIRNRSPRLQSDHRLPNRTANGPSHCGPRHSDCCQFWRVALLPQYLGRRHTLTLFVAYPRWLGLCPDPVPSGHGHHFHRQISRYRHRAHVACQCVMFGYRRSDLHSFSLRLLAVPVAPCGIAKKMN